MKHVTVPEHWSAREALCAADLLQRVTDAIWRAHGPKMVEELATLPPMRRRLRRQRYLRRQPLPHLRNIDIPF